MPATPTHVPALIVNNPGLATVVPEEYRRHVANILAAHWSDVEVAIAPTSNAGQPRETLTEHQQQVLTQGRMVLAELEIDLDATASSEDGDYLNGVLAMMALQMFGDVAETKRVTDQLNPWPPVDDVTLATFGHLVVKTLRNRQLNQPYVESLIAIQQHARDLQIVFSI
jgi:hypothetical protein